MQKSITLFYYKPDIDTWRNNAMTYRDIEHF